RRRDRLDRRRLVQGLGAGCAEDEPERGSHRACRYADRAAASAFSSSGTKPAMRTPSSAARAERSSARRKKAPSSSFQRRSSIRLETVAITATGIGGEVPTTASELAKGSVPMLADCDPSSRTATFSPLAARRSEERTAVTGSITTWLGRLGAAARTK